jgi:FkbM family methyltransferase
MPWRKTYGCYLYNLDKIYADFELEDQKKTIDKQKYKLPQDDQYLKGIFLYKNGLVFIEDSAKKIIKGRDVLDCGAYVGDSAIIFNEYQPKNIYCFEPGTENLKMINKTAELNNMVDKIKSVPLGIAKSKGKLYFSGSGSGFSTITDIKPDENSEEIEVTSVDAYVSENNLNPAVIKMDIEGAEYGAIQGAIATIKKFKPILLISIYHTPVDFFEIKPLIESIADYNFKIRKIESEFLCTDLILIGYPKE